MNIENIKELKNFSYSQISSVSRPIIIDCRVGGPGLIPGSGPILRVLTQLKNEGTAFALQTAGSDDHEKW